MDYRYRKRKRRRKSAPSTSSLYRRIYEYRLDTDVYAGRLALLVDFEGLDIGYYRIRVAYYDIRARNGASDHPPPPPLYQRTLVVSYG